MKTEKSKKSKKKPRVFILAIKKMADKEADTVTTTVLDFYKNSRRFLNKCTKPDRKGRVSSFSPLSSKYFCSMFFSRFRKTIHTFFLFFTFPPFVLILEFTRIAGATGLGFLVMGFVGFFVKLIHIPINNILVG